MKKPQPGEVFLENLLQSDDIIAACQSDLAGAATNAIEHARKGDDADFLAWFEKWRASDAGHTCKFTMDDMDNTYHISINQSGPLYWVRVFANLDPDDEWRIDSATTAGEFNDVGYFTSEKEAKAHAEAEEEKLLERAD